MVGAGVTAEGRTCKVTQLHEGSAEGPEKLENPATVQQMELAGEGGQALAVGGLS